MYVGRDFDPSDSGEAELYGFDFVKDVRPGDTLASAAWSCKVAAISENADPDDPAAYIIGTAGAAGTKTTQSIAGFKPGVTYMLQATATMNSGDIVSLWSHVECKEPA